MNASKGSGYKVGKVRVLPFWKVQEEQTTVVLEFQTHVMELHWCQYGVGTVCHDGGQTGTQKFQMKNDIKIWLPYILSFGLSEVLL